MIKISLGEDDLQTLLQGGVIKKNEPYSIPCEIILKDIGMQRIVEMALVAWAKYVAAMEDEDQRILALIKFDKALKKLAEQK